MAKPMTTAAGALKQRAYDHIRQQLLTGSITAGHRVSDRAIAREIGISRTPIREAIRELESKGLVRSSPAGGTYVTVPDERDFVELYEAREAIETYAAGLAARRATRAQVATLREVLDRHVQACRAYTPPAQGARDKAYLITGLTDMAFHLAILRIVGNRRVLHMVNDLQLMTHMFGHLEVYHQQDVRGGLALDVLQHWRVFQAIRRRDHREARRAIARHLRRGRRNALARVRGNGATLRSID